MQGRRHRLDTHLIPALCGLQSTAGSQEPWAHLTVAKQASKQANSVFIIGHVLHSYYYQWLLDSRWWLCCDRKNRIAVISRAPQIHLVSQDMPAKPQKFTGAPIFLLKTLGRSQEGGRLSPCLAKAPAGQPDPHPVTIIMPESGPTSLLQDQFL